MRKLRSSEISEAKTYNINCNGQHVHANLFCVNCNGIGNESNEKHYPDCNNKEVYYIPSTIEVPRKKSNSRIWKLFKNKYVYVKYIGYWFYHQYSWWFKNIGNKK